MTDWAALEYEDRPPAAEPYDIEHDPWARQPQPGDGVPPEVANIIGDWARNRGPDWAGTGFQARRPDAEAERKAG